MANSCAQSPPFPCQLLGNCAVPALRFSRNAKGPSGQLRPSERFKSDEGIGGSSDRTRLSCIGPNKLRDLQETMIYAASQGQMGAKGAVKVAAKDPGSVKAVLDFIRGRNTPGAQLYAGRATLAPG